MTLKGWWQVLAQPGMQDNALRGSFPQFLSHVLRKSGFFSFSRGAGSCYLFTLKQLIGMNHLLTILPLSFRISSQRDTQK